MATTHSFGALPAITLVVILAFSFGIVSIKGDKTFVEYICRQTSEADTCIELMKDGSYQPSAISGIQERFLSLGRQTAVRLAIAYYKKKEGGNCDTFYARASDMYEQAMRHYRARKYEMVREDLKQVHKYGATCLLETSFTEEIDKEVKIATLNLEILNLKGHP